MESLLRLPEVEGATGLKRSAIYAGIKCGSFPAPVHITPKAVAWPKSEIAHWIDTKIAASRQKVAG